MADALRNFRCKMPAAARKGKLKMSAERQPDWFAGGMEHIWLPYSQMKTAPSPLPVVGTQGVRIALAAAQASGWPDQV